MNIEYHKFYSKNLGREMEFKVYGSCGKPVLCVPCQSGRFYEFEDMHMLDVYAPYIETGKIQVFTIDTIDSDTLASDGDPRVRIERHESWIKYIVEEAVPAFLKINGSSLESGTRLAVTGLSLGALHAATLFFRFPDIFNALMSLSGLYSNEHYFKDYHDDLTYINSPEQFIKGMPADHPYLDKYRSGKIIICVGQGAWENETLASTKYFADVLKEKNVDAWVDIWGQDVNHDWNWWYVQAAYFLPKLLDV